MWRASVPDPADIRRMRDVRARRDINPLAIHVNYLVNLAALDPVIREKSILSFRGELDRFHVQARERSAGRWRCARRIRPSI